MLHESITTTQELVEMGPASDELLILKSFLRNIKAVVERYIEGAEEGLPIIGHHFAWPTEIFYCYDSFYCYRKR